METSMSKPLNTYQRTRSAISFAESVSKTKQSFKDECDINQILMRWRKTGELAHLATRQPTYGDFTNATDYLDAVLRTQAAQADFDSLSARVRARMENNPGVLLEFLDDPANLEEAVELGLIPQPASTPSPPPVVPLQTPPDSPPPPTEGSEGGGE